MAGPIIWLGAQGDVDVFASIEDAELYVEHYDVHPDDFIADANGRRWRATVKQRRVTLSVDRADVSAELLTRLQTLLAPRGIDADAQLHELVDLLIRVYGFSR